MQQLDLKLKCYSIVIDLLTSKRKTPYLIVDPLKNLYRPKNSWQTPLQAIKNHKSVPPRHLLVETPRIEILQQTLPQYFLRIARQSITEEILSVMENIYEILENGIFFLKIFSFFGESFQCDRAFLHAGKLLKLIQRLKRSFGKGKYYFSQERGRSELARKIPEWAKENTATNQCNF